MEFKKYCELNMVICETIYDIIYDTEKELDGHLNLAKLCGKLHSTIMDKLDSLETI